MLAEQATRRQLAIAVAHRSSAEAQQSPIELDRIEALLCKLLERAFGDARITSFVPIFLQRAASETPRRELPLRPDGPPMTTRSRRCANATELIALTSSVDTSARAVEIHDEAPLQHPPALAGLR